MPTEELPIQKNVIRTMKKDIARLQQQAVRGGVVVSEKGIRVRAKEEQKEKEEGEKEK